MLPAATHGDFTQVPTTHSEPASDAKSVEDTNITPLSVDWPALPSACILGSAAVWINGVLPLGLYQLSITLVEVVYEQTDWRALLSNNRVNRIYLYSKL